MPLSYYRLKSSEIGGGKRSHKHESFLPTLMVSIQNLVGPESMFTAISNLMTNN